MKGKRMKKTVISLVWMLLFLSFGFAAAGQKAQAASAVVSLSTGEEEVVKGDKFSVMVTVESSEDIGNVEMFVVFDSSKVAFVKDSKYTIGGDGLVLISDWNESASSTRKRYALEFKAKKKGNCKFSVGDQPVIYLADGEGQMSVSSVNMSINVVTKRTEEEIEDDTQEITVTEQPASDKMAELQNIIVAEGTLIPEFSASITEYKVDVPNEVTRLSMAALAASADADVTIKGNENLAVGENIITIVVEAANGAKKEYNIAVVRDVETLEYAETDGLDAELEFGIHSTETEDGTVITQYTKITVEKLEDETLIPNGYMKTSIRLGETPIIAYMPEDDMDSVSYLIYGTDGTGSTGFYEYNRMEGTLKPYIVDYGGNLAEQSTDIVSANFQMMTAIMILIVICAVLSVSLVLQLLKQRGKPIKEEEDFFKDYL